MPGRPEVHRRWTTARSLTVPAVLNTFCGYIIVIFHNMVTGFSLLIMVAVGIRRMRISSSFRMKIIDLVWQ
jgi:hypothetical protein